MGTVAHQFADILAAAGVKRIYGIVGDSLNGLTDAVRRQGKIEWIYVAAIVLAVIATVFLRETGSARREAKVASRATA